MAVRSWLRGAPVAASASLPEPPGGERFAGRALGRIGRLTKRAEFLAVAAGRRFHTPRMTVQSIMRSQAPGAFGGVRIGLTVTKKVGHATERNRIRRRLREAVIAAHHGWPCATLDVVVVARRDALSAPFPLLIEDLSRALPLLAAGKGSAHPPRGGRGRAPRSPAVAPLPGAQAIMPSQPDASATDTFHD
ncbi:ribonuclease P protein component [Chelatococcus reniformis]|uniref:Ribonuclease P protein component n=1 Tax=Chelatococcus reniformis TaxID=1494448 RepID=A0A916UPE2_9HYPH|nr:ribonuclease P protein component [Chelatococcus reniformis]GGC80195.1 hypothetical protein GCM10010994_42710 [Chelatococcus reniformis]